MPPAFSVPPIPPVPVVIPAGQYPHLRALVKELDFQCAICTMAKNTPIFRTFEEAIKEPLSAPAVPGKSAVTKSGMYATRFLLLCPECRCAPKGGPFIEGEGFIDLLNPAIPLGYKRPQRISTVMQNGGMGFDDAEAIAEKIDPGSVSSVRVPSAKKAHGRLKKTDLNTGKSDKAFKAKKKAKAAKTAEPPAAA